MQCIYDFLVHQVVIHASAWVSPLSGLDFLCMYIFSFVVSYDIEVASFMEIVVSRYESDPHSRAMH